MSESGAGLRVRREALGLSGPWLAEQVGVNERTIRRWESGLWPVPADVEQLLSAMEQTADTIVQRWLRHTSREGVLVPVFATDADLWTAHPEFEPWPASWHRAALGRLRAESPVPPKFVWWSDG